MQNAAWLLAAMDILGSPLQLVTQLAASFTDLLGLPMRNLALAFSILAAPVKSAKEEAAPRGGAPPTQPPRDPDAPKAAEDAVAATRGGADGGGGVWLLGWHAPPALMQRTLRVGSALSETTGHALCRALHGVAQAGYRITGSLNMCAEFTLPPRPSALCTRSRTPRAHAAEVDNGAEL